MHKILNGKKVIFFDIGFTLDRPASGDWMFTNRFLELAGERLKTNAAEKIQQARMKGLDYLAQNHLISDMDGEQACFVHYYTIISDELNLGLSEKDCMDVARDRACNMDNYIIYPDTRKVLETLSRTHALGLISDTWPSIELQLQALDIRKYFSFSTFSFEVGAFKPDPKLFLDALNKCGCPAEQTVFIDDGPQILTGAAELGITPILIAANPASDVDVPYTKIHSLSELL